MKKLPLRTSSLLLTPVALAIGLIPLSTRAAQNWVGTIGDWNDPLNWSSGTTVPANELAVISNTGTAQISSAVPTVSELNVGMGNDSGSVSQTSGSLTVGGFFNLGSNGAGTASGSYSISGGTLTHNSGGDFKVGNGGSGASTLTLSGTGSITNSSGIFGVGIGATGDNVVNIQGGTFTHSGGDFNIADGSGGKGTVNVSGGTLAIGSNYTGIGHGANSTGALNITGGSVTKASGANWNLGQGGSGSVGTIAISSGSLMIAGGSDLRIGDSSGGTGSLTLGGSGSLAIDAAVLIGSASGGTGTFTQTGGTYTKSGGDTLIGVGTSTGTWNHNGGTATVSWTHVGQDTGGTGILNVNGGTLTSTQSIEIGVNSSTGIVNLNGGTILANNFIRQSAGAKMNFNGGTIKAKADNANLLSGFLTGQAIVKAGGAKIDTDGHAVTISAPLEHDPALGGTADGGVVKLGLGTLVLSGANTYTGDTTVLGGTLSITTGFVSGNVILTTGSIFDLNFAGTDTIKMFVIDGVTQPTGTWGSMDAIGVDHNSPFLTGTGVLNVTAVPEPGTVALVLLGGAVCFAAIRRRTKSAA